MLIHQLSAGTYGKFTELEDDMENNKHLMDTIKDIYKAYTGVAHFINNIRDYEQD